MYAPRSTRPACDGLIHVVLAGVPFIAARGHLLAGVFQLCDKGDIECAALPSFVSDLTVQTQGCVACLGAYRCGNLAFQSDHRRTPEFIVGEEGCCSSLLLLCPISGLWWRKHRCSLWRAALCCVHLSEFLCSPGPSSMFRTGH